MPSFALSASLIVASVLLRRTESFATNSIAGVLDPAAVAARFADCVCDAGSYASYVPSNITTAATETEQEKWENFFKWLTNATSSSGGEDPYEGLGRDCDAYRTCVKCPMLSYCPAGGLCWKPVSCLWPPIGFCFEEGLQRPTHSIWGTLLVFFFLCCCCGGLAICCRIGDRIRLTKSRKMLEGRLLEDKLLKHFGEAVLMNVNAAMAASAAEASGGGAASAQQSSIEIVTHEFKGLKRRPRQQQIGIEFENLGLVLPSGKCVLRGVSGEFQRGMLTAVMGPSGSGKTTFLNVLCGRATYGDMFGSIKINGREGRVDQLRTLFGFVPQDDIVFSDLTVRENLRFSAALRLPPHCANFARDRGTGGSFISQLCCKAQAQRRRDIVLDVLHVLGIDHIADEVVGDVEKRGISGGQRKRVNIGLEMVADPAVLFLDEPTSGLDSTASTLVLAALKEVAQLGVTVATVIHQPRYSIFTLFDETLLLAKGGLAVYLGWSSEALSYFESLSFSCPDRVNPADFFLDVISGEVPCPAVQSFDATRDLPQIWEALQHRVREKKKQALRLPQISIPRAVESGSSSNLGVGSPGLGGGSSNSINAAAGSGSRDSARSRSGTQDAAQIEFALQVGRVFDHFDVSRTRSLHFNECKALVAPSLAANGVECSDANIRITIAAVIGKHFDFEANTQTTTNSNGNRSSTAANSILPLGRDEGGGAQQAAAAAAAVQSDATSLDQVQLTRACFIERMSTFRDRAIAMRHEEGVQHVQAEDEEEALLSSGRDDRARNRCANGLLLTFKHTFTRSVTQLGRHTNELIFDAVLAVIPAFVIGLIFTAKWDTFSDSPLIVFLAFLVLALIQVIGTIRVLSSERMLFYRERERGLFVISYFLSKDAMTLLLDMTVRTSLYSGLLYSFLVPQLGFLRLWDICFMVCYYASGVGFLLAATLSPNSALIAGVILPTTTGAMLSGLISAVPNSLTYLSFIRYATEWFFMEELAAIDKVTGFNAYNPESISLTTIYLESSRAKEQKYTRLTAGNEFLSLLGSPVHNGPGLALFLWGLSFRILAIIALHLVNNDRVTYLVRRVMCAKCRADNLRKTETDASNAAQGPGRGNSGVFNAGAVEDSMEHRRTPTGSRNSSNFGSDDLSPGANAAAGAQHAPLRRAASERTMQSGALSLLNSAALQAFTNTATTQKTLRIQLPAGCFGGQQIGVVDPETGLQIGVTVPAGSTPGSFLTVRYTPQQQQQQPPPQQQFQQQQQQQQFQQPQFQPPQQPQFQQQQQPQFQQPQQPQFQQPQFQQPQQQQFQQPQPQFQATLPVAAAGPVLASPVVAPDTSPTFVPAAAAAHGVANPINVVQNESTDGV